MAATPRWYTAAREPGYVGDHAAAHAHHHVTAGESEAGEPAAQLANGRQLLGLLAIRNNERLERNARINLDTDARLRHHRRTPRSSLLLGFAQR